MGRFCSVLILLFSVAGRTQAVDFYQHWGDGRAEISSYSIVQSRYGEPRQGYGVLVFVTEDINRNTFIKVESPTPDRDRLYTLKLNHILKFNTGVYDYSVMTSVFSQVEGGSGSFDLKKITLSAQEWCGHVFEEVQVRGGKLEGDLNSYFEREGRQEYTLEVPPAFESEDHLLIRIRELKGPIMDSGEEREVLLLPSLWNFRAQHKERGLAKGTLSKGAGETIAIGAQSFAAIPWKWAVEEREKTVWVERDYPHRILAWKDSQGSTGELIRTVRQPYWSQNSNADEVWREKLGIP